MTISSTTYRWAYTGDGSTTVFAYNNKIFADSELQVYVDAVLQTLTTDYSVSGAGDDDGGDVTFTSAPASGTSVVIIRNVPIDQETDLPAGGAFPASAVEDAVDKLTIIDQQQEETLSRAPKYPKGTTSEVELANPVAGRALKYNGDGTQIDPVSVGELSDSDTTLLFSGNLTLAKDTVADMKSDTTLQSGMYIRTLEHTSGYGYEGGNLYLARAVTGGTDDNGSLIKSTGNTDIEFVALFGKEIHVKQFGVTGDSSDDQTTALDNAFQYWVTTNKILNPGDRGDVITTSSEITATITASFPGYATIKGDGVAIQNTASNILTIYGTNSHLCKIEGIQFIGSTDDYVTRNANSGLRVDTMFNAVITRCHFAGFNGDGLLIARTLWSSLSWSTFRYCADLCTISNEELDGTVVSANVTEVKRCIFWNALSGGDSKTNATDKCLTILRSFNTRVVQNTFEFPQQHGLRLNRNGATVVESNYFEHGNGGDDILIDGTASFGDYTRLGQNSHTAGSGDGGTSGGHRPITISGGQKIVNLGNYGMGTYHADNIDDVYGEYTSAELYDKQYVNSIDIIPQGDDTGISIEDHRLRVKSSMLDLEKTGRLARRKELAASTSTDLCKITTSDQAHFGIELTFYHGRDASGAGAGIAKAYATYYNSSGTLSETAALAQSTMVGTPFTLSSTLSGNEVTFSVSNSTATPDYAYYELRLMQATDSSGIRVLMAAL